MRMLMLLPLVLLGIGCTRYEYNLVQPSEWSRHIGKETEVVEQPPLVYRMQTYENRLVLRIQNHSDAPVRLLGEESWVVTPDGESRPLRGQSIAPGAFIKLIMPPPAPVYERSGPSFGFGIGTATSSRGRVGTGVGVGTTFGDDRIYVADDDAYWDWQGETTAKLHLVFQRQDDQRITQDFTFERQKM
jgi:hypothetical protein